jgi:hypothetical protein
MINYGEPSQPKQGMEPFLLFTKCLLHRLFVIQPGDLQPNPGANPIDFSVNLLILFYL